MTALLLLLVLTAVVSLVLALVSHACVHVVLARRRTPGPTPPITIFKPLKGLDDSLYENLESFARLDYPQFQIVTGTEDPRDPALDAARRLQREYPNVDIRVVAGGRPLGRNPKVSNLANLARHAKYDHVLISDSNTRVKDDFLRALATELRDPRVGLVSALLGGVGEERLGALFENLHLASFITPGVCSADVLTGHPCVVGKTMLFRLSVLEKLGGWRAVRNILAEDYVLGRTFEKAGYRVVTSPHVVHAVHQSNRVSAFLARHMRWCQMRRRLVPKTFLFEPLLNPTLWLGLVFLSALAVDARTAVPGTWIAAGALVGLAIKYISDIVLLRRLRGSAPHWADLIWIPVKDLVFFWAWVTGSFRRRVIWRGNTLWIGRGSRLLRAPRRALRNRARALSRF